MEITIVLLSWRAKSQAIRSDFVVIAPEQAGNQINETRMRFTGTFKAGEMELTRSREGVRDAANGGAAQVRGDSKQTMKLKRLL